MDGEIALSNRQTEISGGDIGNLGINFHGIHVKLRGYGKSGSDGSASAQTEGQHSVGGDNGRAEGEVVRIGAGPNCADLAGGLRIRRVIEDQPAKIVVVHYGDPVVGGFGGPENGGRIGELRKKERANGRQENCGDSGGSSDEARRGQKKRGGPKKIERNLAAPPRGPGKKRGKRLYRS